jgi:hypothetical protein
MSKLRDAAEAVVAWMDSHGDTEYPGLNMKAAVLRAALSEHDTNEALLTEGVHASDILADAHAAGRFSFFYDKAITPSRIQLMLSRSKRILAPHIGTDLPSDFWERWKLIADSSGEHVTIVVQNKRMR